MLFRADRLRSEQSLMACIQDLDARAVSAYLKLSRHYWQHGRLPVEDRDLGAICKVSVVTMRHMRVQLGWAFDEIDTEGRWRDRQLEAERVECILALGRDPADFAPQDDPVVADAPNEGAPDRTPRSAINSANAVSGWSKRRAREEAQRSPSETGDAAMRVASDPMQTSMRNGLSIDAIRTPDRIDLAFSHPTATLEEEEESNESSSSSSSTAPAVAAADASGHANSHLVSHAPDAKPDATRTAAGGAPQLPLTNRELRDALLLAIGDNVKAPCRDQHSVKPIRDLMREGCDLDRHVLPELRLLAKSSRPLQTWRAAWLHQQIRDRRDASPDERGNAVQTVRPSKIFVEKGTPNWDAWAAYRRKVDGKRFTMSYKRGLKEGWDFDAPWPPGHQPTQVAAE